MSLKITVLITAAVLVALLGRYELVSGGGVGGGIIGNIYRLDRWTGEVVYIYAADGHNVEIK